MRNDVMTRDQVVELITARIVDGPNPRPIVRAKILMAQHNTELSIVIAHALGSAIRRAHD